MVRRYINPCRYRNHRKCNFWKQLDQGTTVQEAQLSRLKKVRQRHQKRRCCECISLRFGCW